MNLDFPELPSVCHFSYHFRSVRQFTLFIDEIFALPFDTHIEFKVFLRKDLGDSRFFMDSIWSRVKQGPKHPQEEVQGFWLLTSSTCRPS